MSFSPVMVFKLPKAQPSESSIHAFALFIVSSGKSWKVVTLMNLANFLVITNLNHHGEGISWPSPISFAFL